uniref:Uncharacterized protein n=1 Tax=Sphaerodactylus townsendi TaxID=933632 RepID=A0ACB8G277_9SAUR
MAAAASIKGQRKARDLSEDSEMEPEEERIHYSKRLDLGELPKCASTQYWGIPILLVGCKTDLRKIKVLLRRLHQNQQEPITYRKERTWLGDSVQTLE